MPRVLLLATTTGYQTRAFGESAERLGVDLVYATNRCDVLEDPWQDQALPVRFHDEPASVAAILEAARRRPIDGVLAVGDRPTVIAALVLESLGLPGHPPSAAIAARNKLLTRERLRDAGLPVPPFVPAHISADALSLAGSLTFPCVVKPLALSGSRGVMRVDTGAELVESFSRLRSLLQAPDIRAGRGDADDMVLIEGFIEGREVALEGVMNHGALHVLALFDKPDPLDGPFFEETIYVTPSAAPGPTQRAIAEGVSRAARALGLRHGPIHAECRVNDRGVFVIEVAARPIGGLCARALRFGQGDGPLISLEELLLRHALGQTSEGVAARAACVGCDDDSHSAPRGVPARCRHRRGALGWWRGRRADHRQDRPDPRAASRRRQLPRFHLRPRGRRAARSSAPCARRTDGSSSRLIRKCRWVQSRHG